MRRILLLVVLVGLALLIWQNWQVSFPIVFLFWRTPAYPFGLLILAGLGLGLLVGMVITFLWSIGQNRVVKAAEPPRRPRPQPPPAPEPDPELEDWFTEPTASPRRASWSEARNVTPPEDQLPRPQESYPSPEAPEVKTPEVEVPESEPVPPEPSPRPARKPRRPRPNVRQDVVDAEFRVLTPPYHPSGSDDGVRDHDDWGDWLEEER
ncbi:hypothetical protein RIF25_01990 [Thermosynechococcaceae cyanobacterium BACA0444]|uniref:Lipopolysaccharide assembly protein A domain-containing protein n=1 Tax=Pseudocalidococcus azoricus BACA0444 TaxID=2918990 RepID=A0AAE4FRA5_9CYAN|nr:hypothetical protein [Pseudocalidococcus azoricus BACA0444]